MSDAISVFQRKVIRLEGEYSEILRERDQNYRETTWYSDARKEKLEELNFARAQLWALQKAKENARVMPQSGYRLAYVAQN